MLEIANLEGNSMVWGSVDSMERRENLSADCLENRKRHAAVKSGGDFRQIQSVLRSPCLKLLAVSLVAQEFTTASAAGICQAFDDVKSRFDLIGLISVLGTAAATKSLSYSALNEGSLYATGHVGPGSLRVAAAMFEATGFRLARLFAFGGAQDGHDLVQLDCPDGLHYVGLKSNTESPVGNAVGASIVQEHQSLWEKSNGIMKLTELELLNLQQKGRNGYKDIEMEGGKKLGRRVGRDAKREVKVIILKVGRTAEQEAWRTNDIKVSLKASKGADWFLGWLPLGLTIEVIASCFFCKLWFVAGLIILGTLGMMVGVLGLRLCVFKYSKPKVPTAAPEGDCLIVDDKDPDILHVVMGEEECIQALFQRKICKIDYQGSIGKYVFFLAGCMLYIYVVASVLYMPNVSVSGQIHFAIANLIGLVTDMVKASRNGKLGLAKKACEQFKIVASDLVVFQNRTAAVAFVAKHANDCTMLKSKKLLPCDGPVWQKWWEVLAKYDGKFGYPNIKSDVAEAEHKHQDLLKILFDDMMDGLHA